MLSPTARIVKSLVRRFHLRYGIPRRVLREEAHTALLDAHWRYHGQVARNTWVWFCILKTFQQLVRERTRDCIRHAPVDVTRLPCPRARMVPLETRLGEASEDAQTVAKTALGLPTRGQSYSTLRRAVVKGLRERGWAGKRILGSIRELKEVLH